MGIDHSSLDSVLNKIRAQYGDSSVRDKSAVEAIPRVSTGDMMLDYMTGGGFPLGRIVHEYGPYCLAPETKILMQDYSWRNLGDLKENDEIIGFEEFCKPIRRGIQRKLEPAQIISNPTIKLPCYKITTNIGETIASEDHLWLQTKAAIAGTPTQWMKTKDLKIGDFIGYFGKPWGDAINKEKAAYLGGLFDGEGSTDGARIRFHQNPGIVFDQGRQFLLDLGFEVRSNIQKGNNNCLTMGTAGTNHQMMKFLYQIPAVRMRKNAKDFWIGRQISPGSPWTKEGHTKIKIESIEYLGEREVCAVETTSKTLIANGMYSHNSSAKTLVAWNVISNAQKMGLKCVYYNAEKQFDPVWVQRWGVDTDKLEVIEGTIIEEIGEQMEALMGVANIHIVDSVAACVSQDELATKAGDWLPGIAARTWGKTLRRVNNRLDDKENMVILINQTRELFGRGGGEAPTGGKSIDFLSSLSLRFRRSSWLYEDKNGILQEEGKGTDTMTGDKEPDGIEFQVRADKSRVSRPFGTARLRFNFNTLKFDDLWSLVRAASHFDVVKRGGSWYTLPDETKVQGENGLRQALIEKPEFRAEVEKVLKNG